MTYPILFLKKNEELRLRKGHLWVFSNEVDNQRSPLAQFQAGELVQVQGANGKVLGTAYINPHALICARLLSSQAACAVDVAFFKARLLSALALREQCFARPYYRLLFGESDGLPGVVVDRFGAVFAVQITTVGMELRKPQLLAALVELFAPEAVVFKNDNSHRQLEGLALAPEIGHGSLPEPLLVEENGLRFAVDIVGGQKTGWFYDHRPSRALAAGLAKNLKVLDLFCYVGAFGVAAAAGGARAVTAVDASEGALRLLAQNARLNQVEGKIHGVRADVFDFLKQARLDHEVYDMVILDPPALVKRKKDFKAGYEAYRRLNHLALQVLAKDGILVSASCSFHLSRDNLQEILRACGRQADRHLAFLAVTGQGPDHPVAPAIAETEYLKTYFCRASPSL